MKTFSTRLIISIASLFTVLLIWESVCVIFHVSDVILPRPSQLIFTVVTKFPLIAPHLGQTLFTTLLGFFLGAAIGVVFGIALGWSRAAYAATYPIIAGLYSIPKAAFVPIFILWFGAGTVPAVLASMIGAVLPVAVNIANSLSTVEPELEDAMIALRAQRSDMIRYLAVPRSMPAFLAALKVAFSLSLIGSVVAEMAASNKGLGNVMMIAIASYDTPLAFSALALLSLLGIVSFALLSFIERRWAFWAHREHALSLE